MTDVTSDDFSSSIATVLPTPPDGFVDHSTATTDGRPPDDATTSLLPKLRSTGFLITSTIVLEDDESVPDNQADPRVSGLINASASAGFLSKPTIQTRGIDSSCPERVKSTYDAVMQCLKNSSGDGPTVYDHLKAALSHVIKNENRSAYSSFEQILSTIDQKYTQRPTGSIRETVATEAKLNVEMLKVDAALEERIDAHIDEDTGKSKLPNLLSLYPFLRNAGIPRLFSTERACMLNMALKKLLDFDSTIFTIRFWGTIYGIKNDYYIAEAEAEPPDDEEDGDPEATETNEENQPEEEDEEKAEIEGFENLPPVPKTLLKPLPPLVKEPSGGGINKKAYYVATKVDGIWTRLPPVTPDQVLIARKIHRRFTGDLKAKVASFPVFPGNESNYLRAQLARISAATHICPNGYYFLEGDDEDYEEGAPPPFNLANNPDYKPPTFQQLSQPHMKSWVHHGQYILRQGRTFFYDAFEADKDEDEEEEPEEEEEEVKVRKPKYPVWYPEKADWYEPEESVPPPLCSVMNDAAIDGYPPWSIHFGSKTFPGQSFVVARSNLWPGAYTVVHDQGRNFFNMYFGRGIKYRSQFVPKMPGHVKHEKYDPTLHEELDPTPEEEDEIRKAAGLDETDKDGEGEEEEEEET